MLAEWLPWKEEFLDEILHLESLGGRPLQCVACQQPATFRCEDCFGLDLLCQACLLGSHARHPFHRIKVCDGVVAAFSFFISSHGQKWNGQYFGRESLAALGLFLQLGHATGERCPHPSRHHQLSVFDVTGVHQVLIRYCLCAPETPGFRCIQLLRSMLFPAMMIKPHTVFTFRLLDYFHQLQSRNKTNLYDFYNTIIYLNDNAGLSPVVVSVLHAYLLPPSPPPCSSLPSATI
jgi:hypothetical protein